VKKDKKQKCKIETCPVCLMNYLKGQPHECPPVKPEGFDDGDRDHD
jgi:hypothetical protein